MSQRIQTRTRGLTSVISSLVQATNNQNMVVPKTSRTISRGNKTIQNKIKSTETKTVNPKTAQAIIHEEATGIRTEWSPTSTIDRA